MKYFINKIQYFLLATMLVISSCEVEDNLNVVAPEAAFTLETPGITSVFLNFSLPNNPAFTITWQDAITDSSSYTVEISDTEEFTNTEIIGTSETASFSMTVTEFNTAINQLITSSFKDVAIYFRVKAGDSVSNTILLLVTTYPINPPSFEGITEGDTFVLSKGNKDAIAVTIAWNDPILDSTLNIDAEYTIEASSVTDDFAAPIEIAKVSNVNNYDVKVSKLNAIALESGIAPDENGELLIRLKSVITDNGNTLERINTPIKIAVTTYKTVLDLSTSWGIVGAFTGWGSDADAPFWKTEEEGVLNAYVTLPVGEIKFRENSAWTNNYGDTGADGTLEAGGTNISITEAGSYKVTMNLNDLTYTIEKFSLGIVGNAYNNWGATPDFMLEYDQYSDVFRGIVTLLDGEMKFRMNNAWDENYGDDGADGTLEPGGQNLSVSAGIYIVTVNLNEKTYSLQQIENVWGLVGNAYNDWGATPDAQFTRDWSDPLEDIWILENVDLLDGEFKFRANNAWDVNYGDNGGDGTLEIGGTNIVSTAGNYTITIDFSNATNPTYTIVQN